MGLSLTPYSPTSDFCFENTKIQAGFCLSDYVPHFPLTLVSTITRVPVCVCVCVWQCVRAWLFHLFSVCVGVIAYFCTLCIWMYMWVHASLCVKQKRWGRRKIECIITANENFSSPQKHPFFDVEGGFSDMVFIMATFLYFNHLWSKTWALEPVCQSLRLYDSKHSHPR